MKIQHESNEHRSKHGEDISTCEFRVDDDVLAFLQALDGNLADVLINAVLRDEMNGTTSRIPVEYMNFPVKTVKAADIQFSQCSEFVQFIEYLRDARFKDVTSLNLVHLFDCFEVWRKTRK